jgi:hypothetical protein
LNYADFAQAKNKMANFFNLFSRKSEKTVNKERMGGELHLFFLVECSSGMAGDKIGMINSFFRTLLDKLSQLSPTEKFVCDKIMIRVISIASEAWWHIGPNGASVENASWSDLIAGGGRNAAEAMEMLYKALVYNGSFDVPPMIFFITANAPCTDETAPNYKTSVQKLNESLFGPWNRRYSIVLGMEGEAVHEEIASFSSDRLQLDAGEAAHLIETAMKEG